MRKQLQITAKIQQKIITTLKNRLYNTIRSTGKLQFYSTFKTDQSSSLQLELIENVHHRQSVAKLRSGNHDLRIKTGRYCVPKIPENLRICPYHHHQSLFKNTKSYHKNALPRSRVKNYKRINQLYLQEYINYIS